MWVLPNEIPYDPQEAITILPMFTRPALNDGGTWLGDLQAGTEVALQGWSTMGWVACNRLRLHEMD